MHGELSWRLHISWRCEHGLSSEEGRLYLLRSTRLDDGRPSLSAHFRRKSLRDTLGPAESINPESFAIREKEMSRIYPTCSPDGFRNIATFPVGTKQDRIVDLLHRSSCLRIRKLRGHLG